MIIYARCCKMLHQDVHQEKPNPNRIDTVRSPNCQVTISVTSGTVAAAAYSLGLSARNPLVPEPAGEIPRHRRHVLFTFFLICSHLILASLQSQLMGFSFTASGSFCSTICIVQSDWKRLCRSFVDNFKLYEHAGDCRRQLDC